MIRYVYPCTPIIIGPSLWFSFLARIEGERNPTSTKGRSRWKSSSENYLLIAEVRVMVRVRLRLRVMVRVRVRDSKTIFYENYFWWMSNCVNCQKWEIGKTKSLHNIPLTIRSSFKHAFEPCIWTSLINSIMYKRIFYGGLTAFLLHTAMIIDNRSF